MDLSVTFSFLGSTVRVLGLITTERSSRIPFFTLRDRGAFFLLPWRDLDLLLDLERWGLLFERAPFLRLLREEAFLVVRVREDELGELHDRLGRRRRDVVP